jgi:hypothetical protein
VQTTSGERAKTIQRKAFLLFENNNCIIRGLMPNRVRNFRDKIIPWKTEQTEQMVISDGIPDVPRKFFFRNSVPNSSAEEKTTPSSVPWNKKKANSHNYVPNPSAEEKAQHGIPFRGTKIEASSRNSVPNLQATCSILTTQLFFPIHPNISGICRVDRIGI